MGGGGTYKLLERWPDLFARGFGAAAAPMDDGTQGQSMASLRNDPILTWISSGDEGTTIDQQEQSISSLESHGLRFTFDQFPGGDHLTLATNDEYGPAAAFLGTATTELDPAHVTYVVDPANDFTDTGVVADHAYWLSGLTVRSDGTGALGQIDAYSEAFGTADPVPNPPSTSAGLLTGGYHGPMPYVQTAQSWSEPVATAPADRLDLTATNIATATIDAARARLDCHATLELDTDGPITVSIPACDRTIQAGAGESTFGF
jgi:hypothetical protein